MPIAFYGDEGNRKYHSAYFARFDNVWTHGDFIMEDPGTRSIIFLGRADGVLNPSGIRFGSAEIYSVIDNNFKTIVEDSICVGQRRSQDQDVRIRRGRSSQSVANDRGRKRFYSSSNFTLGRNSPQSWLQISNPPSRQA